MIGSIVKHEEHYYIVMLQAGELFTANKITVDHTTIVVTNERMIFPAANLFDRKDPILVMISDSILQTVKILQDRGNMIRVDAVDIQELRIFNALTQHRQ